MDASAKQELNQIKAELNAIIRELESISDGVRSDFSGIGNDRCADCIDSVINTYLKVKRQLANMDTETVTESFAAAHAESTGSSGGHGR